MANPLFFHPICEAQPIPVHLISLDNDISEGRFSHILLGFEYTQFDWTRHSPFRAENHFQL